jgi:hypothetical protein
MACVACNVLALLLALLYVTRSHADYLVGTGKRMLGSLPPSMASPLLLCSALLLLVLVLAPFHGVYRGMLYWCLIMAFNVSFTCRQGRYHWSHSRCEPHGEIGQCVRMVRVVVWSQI